MAAEASQYEMAKVAIADSAEKQVAEIYAMRDETLAKEDDRHYNSMEQYDINYEQKVEDAIVEHEEIVKGLRDAYLTDLGLDKYLDSLDAEYLADINADDYAKAIKVEAYPAE